MFCWHKWTKWEEYDQIFKPRVNMELVYLALLDKNVKQESEYVEIWQHRRCEKCGKHQREKV